jgi:hypothetical protein
MRFLVEASVGNSDGAFDAAYEFGSSANEEAQITGTPEQIGREVTRYLSTLTPADCQTMRYGTSRFFLELIVTPDEGLSD